MLIISNIDDENLRKIGQKHFIMYPVQKHIYVKKINWANY